MIKKIIRFITLLDIQTQKKFISLFIFVFLGSIVEIFSFGSIMPMIDLIVNLQDQKRIVHVPFEKQKNE